jgi:RNA polymerase sigma-70 factor (ECF subfamily)
LENRADSGGACAALGDEELFERIRSGSEPHFNVIYDRYFQRIYSFIYLRVRNHADAEELTQETFTAVFRSIDDFSGRSTPLGWIYGIAKNTVHSHLRKARIQGERMRRAGVEALTAASPNWSCTPEDQLAMRRYARAMDARLRSVSDWQAEIFFLRHVDDLPIGEISRRTMRSSDAIRSGLYRVKRLLKEAGERDSPAVEARAQEGRLGNRIE